jgi:prepilin peptidase CpaA
MTVVFLLFLILPSLVFLSAITDIYSYSIPNSFSLVLTVAFYVFALLNPVFDWALIGEHTLACLIVFGITFVLFACNLLGGGDAKILMASSLWVGLNDLILYLCFITIIGGLFSIFLSLWRKTKTFEFYKKYTPIRNLYFGYQEATEITTQNKTIPYAVAIAIGFGLFLPQSFILSSV